MSAFGAFGDNNLNIFTRVIVFTAPAILVSVLAGLLFGTLVNVFASSVWTLAYREWNKPAQPTDAALQPSAPPSEPIPPIESLGTSAPSNIEPSQGDKA
jgi:hypothetical protein